MSMASIGGIVGAVVAVALIFGLIIICCYCCRKKEKAEEYRMGYDSRTRSRLIYPNGC